jgi:hypothetical protein
VPDSCQKNVDSEKKILEFFFLLFISSRKASPRKQIAHSRLMKVKTKQNKTKNETFFNLSKLSVDLDFGGLLSSVVLLLHERLLKRNWQVSNVRKINHNKIFFIDQLTCLEY